MVSVLISKINSIQFSSSFNFDRFLNTGEINAIQFSSSFNFDRFLNTGDYFGGFEQEDINELCGAMEMNYKSWVSGFAPLAVGGDMDSAAV